MPHWHDRHDRQHGRHSGDQKAVNRLPPDQLAQQHPFDKAFLDSMIAHHASVIEMASVALLRSQNPDIVRIAAAIKLAQGREIGQMTQWRSTWYPSQRRNETRAIVLAW
jgi:uncharacterized protein (DUF305 family)